MLRLQIVHLTLWTTRLETNYRMEPKVLEKEGRAEGRTDKQLTHNIHTCVSMLNSRGTMRGGYIDTMHMAPLALYSDPTSLVSVEQ